MSSFNTPPAERLGGAPAAKSAAKRDVAVSAGAVQTPATVGAESARRRASGGSACVASVRQWAPKRRDAVAPGGSAGAVWARPRRPRRRTAPTSYSCMPRAHRMTTAWDPNYVGGRWDTCWSSCRRNKVPTYL